MSTTDTTTCHHGLGPVHPWEPDRYCPPEPVEPAPDVERGEWLREARKVAARARVSSVGWSPLDRRTITTLDAEVARLDAVVTAVQAEVESWATYPGHTAEAQYFRRYLGDLIRRALDGGAA